jgi:aspartyl protease family protein
MRHLSVAAGMAALAATLATGQAGSARVTLLGLFPGKAVIVVNGQEPRTVSVGQKTAEGVTLLSTGSGSAVFDIEGRKETLELGQHFVAASGKSSASIAIAADGQGHHWAQGQINGRPLRFLVDTGATTVTLPGAFARTAGIDYLKGQRGLVQTANGSAAAYRVRLDAVSVGDITVYQVDAIILETGLDNALLGMSFLSRTDMKRDGANLVLTKRF